MCGEHPRDGVEVPQGLPVLTALVWPMVHRVDRGRESDPVATAGGSGPGLPIGVPGLTSGHLPSA